MNLMKQLLYFACTVGVIVNFLQGSTANAAFERTSSHMMRRIIPSFTAIVVAPNGGYRWHSTTSTSYPKGIYTQATEDPIFKYINFSNANMPGIISSSPSSVKYFISFILSKGISLIDIFLKL